MSRKCYSNLMNVEEIRGQRILTSLLPPQDKVRVEIFAKNIPQYLNEDDIVPFFEKVGPLHILRLMLDKNNKGNRGFVYLTYLDSDDAKTAIRCLNGREIVPNCPLTVTQSMNNCRIFLGGIPVKKTKDEVWQELTKRGITGIVDVIMYRSYNNRAENRGFVFVEFPTHQYAAKMRNKMKGMSLWNNEVIVDWSVPESVVSEDEMKKVKILYLRNLNVMESREYLKAIVEMYTKPEFVEKVYKFKDYAFIHLTSREAATELLKILTKHYRNTAVEVTFAKPSSEFTKPEYRKMILSKSCNSSPPLSETSPISRQKTFSETEEEMRFLSSLQRQIQPNNFHEFLDPYRNKNLATSSPLLTNKEQNYPAFSTPDTQRPQSSSNFGSSLRNLQEGYNSLRIDTSRENEPFLPSIPTLKCSNLFERNLLPRTLDFASFLSPPSNRRMFYEVPERLPSARRSAAHVNKENSQFPGEENLRAQFLRQKEAKSAKHEDKENWKSGKHYAVSDERVWPSFPCSWADILCQSERETKPFSSIENIPENDRCRIQSHPSFLEPESSPVDEFHLLEEKIRKFLKE